MIDLTLIRSCLKMKYGNYKRKKKHIVRRRKIRLQRRLQLNQYVCVCVCVYIHIHVHTYIHTCLPVMYIFESMSYNIFKERLCQMWLLGTYLCHKSCRHAHYTLLSFICASCKGRYYLV